MMNSKLDAFGRRPDVSLAFWAAVAMVAVLVFSAAIAQAGQKLPQVSELAKQRKRPPGAPKASDVLMRSLCLRSATAADSHDTIRALADFHVTRLEWAYICDKAAIDRIKSSGCLFGGAASAPSYSKKNKEPDWFEKVVILNLEGRPIIAPWKRTWKRTLWGCINNAELERGYVEYLKQYIDAGAQVMQRDEPSANFNATRWGGCFCPHCMKAFRQYLAKNTTPDQRHRLGIADIESFNYREHLKKQNAPVGDAFGRWKGGPLKELFVRFQMEATLAFHRRTRGKLDAYAGRHVPFSCNNGAHRWSPLEETFDWVFGELSYGHARPERLHDAMRKATAHDRIQVVTMPKKGDYKNLDEWERRTRQTIGTAYASGGLCMVPWDVFMPNDAPRYFGTAKQYADLFGFVRAVPKYLDGYEEAAVVGNRVKDTGYGDTPPVVVERNADLWVFVRAKPGDAGAPVVVHLVDWGAEAKPATLKLHSARFFGDKRLAAKLLVPPEFVRQEHEKAEAAKNYSSLVEEVAVSSRTEGASLVVDIPSLKPWGILVVLPRD